MKKMKVLLIIFIIVLICTICFMFFYNTARFYSEGEIIDLFKENRKEFIDSSSVLIKYRGFWSIRKKTYGTEFRTDWEDVELGNGIHFIIHDKTSQKTDLLKYEIERSESIERILEGLNFKIITSNMRIDEVCIYYIKQTRRASEAGIIYCPIGEKIENPYITKLIPIESAWYYYESK